MILLAALLLALTLVEYSLAQTVRPGTPVRLGLALLAGGALALALGVGAVGALLAVGVGAFWALLRTGHPWQVPGLVVLALVMVLAVVGGTGVGSADSLVGQLFSGGADGASEGAVLADVSFEQAVLAVAALLFLLRPANVVVRVVLQHAGPGVLEEERQLRGGRTLGPLERWFIFALSLGGHLGVVAVVVAAKGLLRFPEISRDSPEGTKAEYVLVGSFVSWGLALVLVPLF